MRRAVAAVLAGVVVFAVGCRQDRPVTAGGQPVSHWVQAARDPDARVRKKAVQKLGNVGAADPEAIPALIAALKDRDARVRDAAALALSRIGPPAGSAAPALEEAARDADATMRGHAAVALERVRGAR